MGFVFLLCLLALADAVQTAPPVAAQASAPAASENAAPAAGPTGAIPPLTPVRIRFDVDLGSKISKSGDMFPITLAEPIMLDGKIAVPAGATGQGEVIHAKKAGGSGAGGELVLAARYIDVGEHRLRLRSLQASAAGHDVIHGAVVASTVVTPLGFLMTGKQTLYPKGWIAQAKTAEAFPLGGLQLPGSPSEQGVSSNGEGIAHAN